MPPIQVIDSDDDAEVAIVNNPNQQQNDADNNPNPQQAAAAVAVKPTTKKPAVTPIEDCKPFLVNIKWKTQSGPSQVSVYCYFCHRDSFQAEDGFTQDSITDKKNTAIWKASGNTNIRRHFDELGHLKNLSAADRQSLLKEITAFNKKHQDNSDSSPEHYP